MVGAIVSTSSIADTQHPTPCFDSYRRSKLCFRARGEVGFCRSLQGRRQLKLGSRAANGVSRKRQKVRKFVVFGELKGQTDDSFNDVKDEIVNMMTYKAVRTVLHQLYEMNPPQYTWFYNFIARQGPNTGKGFLMELFKERRELAERVMITRLHLYSMWMKMSFFQYTNSQTKQFSLACSLLGCRDVITQKCTKESPKRMLR